MIAWELEYYPHYCYHESFSAGAVFGLLQMFVDLNHLPAGNFEVDPLFDQLSLIVPLYMSRLIMGDS